MANVRGVEIAHGGDIGKYYKSGTAQPSFIKKIKVCGRGGFVKRAWKSALGLFAEIHESVSCSVLFRRLVAF